MHSRNTLRLPGNRNTFRYGQWAIPIFLHVLLTYTSGLFLDFKRCYIAHHFSVVAHIPSLYAATSSGCEKYGANTSALNTTIRGPCLREITFLFAVLFASSLPDSQSIRNPDCANCPFCTILIFHFSESAEFSEAVNVWSTRKWFNYVEIAVLRHRDRG